MPGYTTARIRNLALAGHAGAGKTTLLEALLQAGGELQAAGSVERGTTFSDFDPQEKARGHSMNSTIASIDHAGIHVNLIDTPGYPDFRGPTLSALAAVETCAVVVDAVNGNEYGTQRLMDYARARRLCRLLVVNRIDAADADLAGLLDQLQAAYGPECLPMNLPTPDRGDVIDCLAGGDGDSALGPVADWHQRIVDQVVEINETIMGRYLEEGESALTGAELHDAFEQCLREGHLVPVCFVSAREGTGVEALLDLIERWMPNPAEANPPPYRRGEGVSAEPVEAVPDPEAHVIADVFKLINDPFVGKLGVFRVHQGTVRRDSQLFIDDGRKPFKVGHLFKLHGKAHSEVEAAIPGDIAAVAKVEDLHFDAVLHDSHDEDHIHLAPLDFPRPMFGLALTPLHRGQEQKLANALDRLAEEDPCFAVEHHGELNQTLVHGLGELHLKVMLERLKERYGVEVDTAPPAIAYRETIAGRADGHHRHKKQTGGAGQFGEVYLRVEPLPRGGGFEFVDEVKGGTIPGQFLPSVEKGIRQALSGGAIAGFPLQDIRVVVYDGKHHPVDSKEVAFMAAGRKAFLDAVQRARPLVLEPIVNLEVATAEAHVGDITGGLAAKRARINGTDVLRNGEIVIQAQVPLAEVADYAIELKSVTAGRGRFTLEFSHYEAVPPALQKQLADGWHPHEANG